MTASRSLLALAFLLLGSFALLVAPVASASAATPAPTTDTVHDPASSTDDGAQERGPVCWKIFGAVVCV